MNAEPCMMHLATWSVPAAMRACARPCSAMHDRMAHLAVHLCLFQNFSPAVHSLAHDMQRLERAH